MSTSQNHVQPMRPSDLRLLNFLVFLLFVGVVAALGGLWLIYQEQTKTLNKLALSTPTVSTDLSGIEEEIRLLRAQMAASAPPPARDDSLDHSIEQLDGCLVAIVQRIDSLTPCAQKLDAANTALGELRLRLSETHAQLTAISAALSKQTPAETPEAEFPAGDVINALTVVMQTTLKDSFSAANRKQLATFETLNESIRTTHEKVVEQEQSTSEHHASEVKLLQTLSARLDLALEALPGDAADDEHDELSQILRRVEASLKPLENMVTVDEYRRANGRFEAAFTKLAELMNGVVAGRKNDAEFFTTIQASIQNVNNLVALVPTRRQFSELLAPIDRLCSKMDAPEDAPNGQDDQDATDELVRRISLAIREQCSQVIEAVSCPDGEPTERCDPCGSVLHLQLPLHNRTAPVAHQGFDVPAFQFHEPLPYVRDPHGLVLDSVELSADFPRGARADAAIDHRTNSVIVSVYWAGDGQMRALLERQIQQGIWRADLKLSRYVDLAEAPAPHPAEPIITQ